MLKTSLIGLGRIGWQYHLPEIVAHEGFELTAVVDTSEERLEEARKQYGVRGYADYADMLRREHPDLVVIASPTHFHREHAVACMRAGASVFLDKPMAATLADAREIVDVHRETGRKVMIYQPHRVVPEVAVMRRIFSLGILGEVYMIKRASSNYVRRSDWQSQSRFGGGMLNNYGAHLIDQLMYLSGGEAQRITCYRYRAASLGDADDVVKTLIHTTDGVTLDLDITQASAQTITPWMVFGTYGTLRFVEDGEGNASFSVRYVDPGELPELELNTELAAPGRLYIQGEPIAWKESTFPITPADAGDFYEKCRAYYAEDASPFVPIEESLRVMEIIDRCHKDSSLTLL